MELTYPKYCYDGDTLYRYNIYSVDVIVYYTEKYESSMRRTFRGIEGLSNPTTYHKLNYEELEIERNVVDSQ